MPKIQKKVNTRRRTDVVQSHATAKDPAALLRLTVIVPASCKGLVRICPSSAQLGRLCGLPPSHSPEDRPLHDATKCSVSSSPNRIRRSPLLHGFSSGHPRELLPAHCGLYLHISLMDPNLAYHGNTFLSHTGDVVHVANLKPCHITPVSKRAEMLLPGLHALGTSRKPTLTCVRLVTY
jgi:hypothetical protein